MRNKILIAIATCLIGLVIFVRYSFKSQFASFKEAITEFEKVGEANMEKNNSEKLAFLRQSDTALFRIYSSHYKDTFAYSFKDTAFQFLYLSDKIQMKIPNLSYIECLYRNCIVIHSNDSVNKLINPKVFALKKKHPESFDIWYPKLKNYRLSTRKPVDSDCPGIDSLYLISYNAEAWKEFNEFLSDYEKEKAMADYESKNAESELRSLIAGTRAKFKSNMVNLFDNKIESNRWQLISTVAVPGNYSGKILGDLSFNLNKTIVNRQRFDAIADEVFEEQWKYNSLNQGAMPYSYCYGSSNYCGDWCSEISVLSGSSDVLVTIKNSDREVCRHAYIKAGRTFKFHVPDGSYQVFFYSGTGWNPNKVMTRTACGILTGGFVSNESFTKDNYIDLYSQIMSYELILQQNGNLSTQPSSMNEAL